MGSTCLAQSSEKSGLQSRFQQIDDASRLQYLYNTPVGPAGANGKFPLVVFLHGGGEGGRDIERVKKHGLPKLIEAGKSFPFYVVAPQNPSETQFWDDQSVMRLIDEFTESHPVDPSRIYLTGLSRGSYGVWRLAIQNPDRFAALVPISGGGPLPYVKQIREIPTWVFHGAKDPVIPVDESRRLVQALKNAGGKVRYTEYPSAKHDAWTETYESPELYTWMLAQRKPSKTQSE